MNYEIWPCDCRQAMALMPENSVDSVVCDPPYGLSKEPDVADVLKHWLAGDDYAHKSAGFMNAKWDSFVPGPSVWREAYRVLKPGGHLVAFFGTRTYDLGVMALRLAGFEVRDQLAWVFGSGFPKSHDVSKGIDKLNGNAGRELKFCIWFRTTGVTRKQATDVMVEAGHIKPGGTMAGHYFAQSMEGQPALPTGSIWQTLRPLCPSVPAWVDEIIARDEAERAVIGSIAGGKLAVAPGQENDRSARTLDITKPATPEAAQWSGWGTALKPAYEPIVLCRKPLSERTVAANVLRWGTGAVNIDGCRVGDEVRVNPAANKAGGASLSMSAVGMPEGVAGREAVGRWPANLAHDGSDEATAGMGDAQRYFYCAKASKTDRNRGLDEQPEQPSAASQFRPNHAAGAAAGEDGNPYGRWKPQKNTHPTVKPTALMQWLVRMVTQPGGLVLDPFMGSGSTGVAAMLEGFEFIGCEMTEEYIPIATARIDNAVKERYAT